MNVLMIGGTGILSTDVCRRALDKNYDVYMFNRGTRKYNIEDGAHLIKCDVRAESIEEIKRKIKGLYFDVVIDFLCMSVANMQKSFEIIKDQCKQYVFISSATAYEKSSEDEVITEQTPIGNEKWEYAAKKARCERYLAAEYLKYCEMYTIIRPYVTYSHTRIPYAIIAKENWTFIHRIMVGKPILLWNHGENICTITNTRDFAVGVVGLFGNIKAKNEAFHITSDYRMTWGEVLNKTIVAIGCETDIVDKSSDEICLHMPEYAGVLYGDKGTNMMFDNSKIKDAVPEFDCKIPYEEGVKDTVNFYMRHKEIQVIDYAWEGRMDWYLSNYCYGKNSDMQNRLKLIRHLYPDYTFKDYYHYVTNRYAVIKKANDMIRGKK